MKLVDRELRVLESGGMKNSGQMETACQGQAMP
jgi:hypothetical protein